MIVLRETLPVARKAHRCGVCDLPIPAGMRHYAQANTYDGVQTWRAHLGCDDAIRRMGHTDPDGCMHLDDDTADVIREWCGPWIDALEAAP